MHTHTYGHLRNSLRTLLPNSPQHLFIPSPHSSLFPCLSESESKKEAKKEERKTAWVNLGRETSSGSFSFFKRTPPDLMFNLWRRDQAWYILAWQAESIFVWETWIGPDQGWYASPCQGPRGATDWSTAGSKTNPFIGTRAWLIKQVPLGQKAAGVGLLHVPVSARLAGRHTPLHNRRGDVTLFFNVECNVTQEKNDGMLLFKSI